MDRYLQSNRKHWDELVPLHAKSDFYAVPDFLAGKTTLKPLELGEIGDVRGRSLLHLQCHFGLDTLSWARLGAEVTGVDFSETGISLARSLAEKSGLSASFVCSDIYALPEVLDRQFDIVFTSYGVLYWLPDLVRWARIAASFLKPGGKLYIAELHPFAWVLEQETESSSLNLAYPYFHEAGPLRIEEDGSYADRQAHVENKLTCEWNCSIGDVVGALISAGLQLEFLHEFPFGVCQMFPSMKRGDDGWWYLPHEKAVVPLTFSIRARKPV